jgi:hypothetical protein
MQFESFQVIYQALCAIGTSMTAASFVSMVLFTVISLFRCMGEIDPPVCKSIGLALDMTVAAFITTLPYVFALLSLWLIQIPKYGRAAFALALIYCSVMVLFSPMSMYPKFVGYGVLATWCFTLIASIGYLFGPSTTKSPNVAISTARSRIQNAMCCSVTLDVELSLLGDKK